MSGGTRRYRKGEIGRLYGVGVGPGDPELLTLKARRVLSEVPVVFVPRKAEQSKSMAESIIGNLPSGRKPEIVGMVLPMLKDRQRLEAYWRRAADTVWKHLEQGEDCAFVNVGDPLLYGTFIHVLATLRGIHPEVEVEVVPGISSINAAAARAVVPLASNDDCLAVISAGCEERVVRQALENFDTVVFIKMGAAFDKLVGILEEMELLEKCVYVKRCATHDEEIIRDIGKLRGEKVDYFSLLIVRK